MGIIKSEAQRAFFDSHRSNADLVKLFLNGFDITFACEKRDHPKICVNLRCGVE